MRTTQAHLNALGQQTGHQFQVIKVKQMLNRGWSVYLVKSRGSVSVVLMSHPSEGSAIVQPNGLFFKAISGKINWSWDKMAALAAATVPAPGVLHTPEKV